MLAAFVIRRLRTIVLIALVAVWAGKLATDGLLWVDRDVHYIPSSPGATTPAAHGQQLLDAHDCWRDRAPRDMRNKVPGHVVVTTRAGRTRLGGAHLVGLALDQQFTGKKAGLTIWGFCR